MQFSKWKKCPNAPHKWSGALIDHTDFFAHPNATLIVFFLDLEFHSFSMVSRSHTIPIIKETASQKCDLVSFFYHQKLLCIHYPHQLEWVVLGQVRCHIFCWSNPQSLPCRDIELILIATLITYLFFFWLTNRPVGFLLSSRARLVFFYSPISFQGSFFYH